MTLQHNTCRADQSTNDYQVLHFAGMEPRTHYHSVSYRIDMLYVLEHKESAAIIYQVIYRWLDSRRTDILREIEQRRIDGMPALTAQDVEDRLWVPLSCPSLVRETGGAISYHRVVAALNYLVTARGILKRRKARNSRVAIYEYSIEQQKVRELLKALPVFPASPAREVKHTVSSAHSLSQTGIARAPENAPRSDRDTSKTGTDPTTTTGAPPENWIPCQGAEPDFSHKNTLQQSGGKPYVATRFLSQRNFSPQHLAERYRPRQSATGVPASPSQQRPPAIRDADEDPPLEPEPGGALTAESIVALFERLRGQSYRPIERQQALAAARAVLHLRLPIVLSERWLERIYATFNNFQFREWYGPLELHHLPQYELTGQIRLVRWIHRLIALDERQKKAASACQTCLVEREGQVLTVEKARQPGYQDGFEIFRNSGHLDQEHVARISTPLSGEHAVRDAAKQTDAE